MSASLVGSEMCIRDSANTKKKAVVAKAITIAVKISACGIGST
ncbi:hypothetical protein JMUB7542_28090 [Staphylococcus aureus]